MVKNTSKLVGTHNMEESMIKISTRTSVIGVVLIGVGVYTVTDVSVNTRGLVAATIAVWKTALQQHRRGVVMGIDYGATVEVKKVVVARINESLMQGA